MTPTYMSATSNKSLISPKSNSECMKPDFSILFTIFFDKIHNFLCIVNRTISNQDNVVALDLIVWVFLNDIEDILYRSLNFCELHVGVEQFDLPES